MAKKKEGHSVAMEPVFEAPIMGQIAYYVFDQGRLKGQVRPAMIVAAGPGEKEVNLTIFPDGARDGFPSGMLLWRPGVLWSPDKLPGTWHWPEEPEGIESSEGDEKKD